MTFIIENKNGSTLTTTGEFKPSSMVGPGGYCAKTWKSNSAADAVVARWNAARQNFARVLELPE